MKLVAGSGELDKTRFQETLLEQELGGLRYSRQIRLGESPANSCITTDCLVDRLLLGGWRRGFLQSSLVSSSITHRRVICVCILLPYSFTFYFILCLYEYMLVQFVCLSTRIYTIPHLKLSQCKIYQAVTLILGSIQLLCF